MAEHAIRHFHDPASGIFHFTSDLDPALIARPTELHDNVIPASNSSMAKGLFLLGTLFDDERYLKMSSELLATIAPRMASYPSGHSNWAQLMLAHTFPYPEIAITGSKRFDLRSGFATHYLPNRQFLGSTAQQHTSVVEGQILRGQHDLCMCGQGLPIAGDHRGRRPEADTMNRILSIALFLCTAVLHGQALLILPEATDRYELHFNPTFISRNRITAIIGPAYGETGQPAHARPNARSTCTASMPRVADVQQQLLRATRQRSRYRQHHLHLRCRRPCQAPPAQRPQRPLRLRGATR